MLGLLFLSLVTHSRFGCRRKELLVHVTREPWTVHQINLLRKQDLALQASIVQPKLGTPLACLQHLQLLHQSLFLYHVVLQASNESVGVLRCLL